MTTVIILQYNNSRLTKDAIESLLRYNSGDYEIILVDNGSTEENWITNIQDISELRLIRVENNLGFGTANNLAAKEAKGDVLFFLNNDTITTTSIISIMEQELAGDSKIGIIGPKIFNVDGTLQLSFGNFPTIIVELLDKVIYRLVDKKNKIALKLCEKHYSKRKVTEWLTGAAFFIKKDLFFSVGGFDENFFMYFEDKELCKRVYDAGYKNIFLPDVSLIHLRGASATESKKKFLDTKYRESQKYFYQKHRPKTEQILLKLYQKLAGKSVE